MKNKRNHALIGNPENTYDPKKRSIVILDTVMCANPFIGRQLGISPVRLIGRMRMMTLSFNPVHFGVVLRKAAKLRQLSYSEGGTTMNDLFFKVISRDDPMFKDRSWTVINLGDDKGIEIPVPDGWICCDICGEKIESLAISLLRQKVGGDEIGLGAVCNGCKGKYHSDVPTRLIKLRGLPSLKKV